MGNKLIAGGFVVLVVLSTVLAMFTSMTFPGVGVLNIQNGDDISYSPLENPEEYPITRPLYLYTDGIPAENSSLHKWLEYIYSDDGQRYVKNAGFYPVGLEVKDKMQAQLNSDDTNDKYGDGEITQSGSTTLGDLATLWANDFQKKYEILMHTPVYVDSPLAISATQIFRQNTELFDEDVRKQIESGDNPLEFPGLQFTQTAEESKALNENKTPSIIISASGMCEVGRIKHHLKHNLWNPNSTILFVGYQAPGTLGAKLVAGEKKVKIFGEEVAVNARIEYIEGYSGHADQEGLLNFVYSFITKPKHIFLVHGEPEGQKILKQKLMETTEIPVTIPDYGEDYKLDDKISVESKVNMYDKHRYLRLEVIDRLSTLKEELEDMSSMIKDDIFDEDKKDEEIMAINEKIKELEQQIVKTIS